MAPLPADDSAAPPEQARALIQALQDDRIDEAEARYAELCAALPQAEELLVFPVLFAIQRGQLREAMQTIQDLPEERCPELRALCLHLLGDPTWEGQAQALQDSPDPHVRQAMRQLLGRQDHAFHDAA